MFPVIVPRARPTAQGVENQGLSTTSLLVSSWFVPLCVPEGQLVSSGPDAVWCGSARNKNPVSRGAVALTASEGLVVDANHTWS